MEQFLTEQGYYNVCEKNGRLCAMFRFLFTVAIIADIDDNGYENRWCYHDGGLALQEFNAWDGVDEPQGWHRHLPTMRRRNEAGEDIGVY